MTQLLSIVAAALYGVADFSGGMAAKTHSAWRVTAWSQLIGVPLLLVAIGVLGATEVTGRDMALGAVAGIFGLAGLVLMYSALATGTMSVIAPIIGALGAAIAIAWDVATGGTITTFQWAGIAISVVAVVLLASQGSGARVDKWPILKAVGSAAAFAAFFIAMSYTGEGSALWPLAAARIVTVPVAFLIAGALHSASLPDRPVLPLVAFTGLADMGASLAIVLALQRGSLGLSTMLASLYPAFTVVAAMLILKERPNQSQRVGIALAFLGALILAS